MYEYLAAIIYMFILHLSGKGKETFKSTSKTKKYCMQIPIIIFLIWLLCYTDWYLPPITKTIKLGLNNRF